jgi:hypothetical protein
MIADVQKRVHEDRIARIRIAFSFGIIPSLKSNNPTTLFAPKRDAETYGRCRNRVSL